MLRGEFLASATRTKRKSKIATRRCARLTDFDFPEGKSLLFPNCTHKFVHVLLERIQTKVNNNADHSEIFSHGSTMRVEERYVWI